MRTIDYHAKNDTLYKILSDSLSLATEMYTNNCRDGLEKKKFVNLFIRETKIQSANHGDSNKSGVGVNRHEDQ